MFIPVTVNSIRGKLPELVIFKEKDGLFKEAVSLLQFDTYEEADPIGGIRVLTL